jgi:hypothetical protein
MLEFLIEEIFVELGGTIFQQITSMPMGTSCAPLLATLFLDSYEVECIRKIIKDKRITEANAVNSTFRYIGDVLYSNFSTSPFSDY